MLLCACISLVLSLLRMCFGPGARSELTLLAGADASLQTAARRAGARGCFCAGACVLVCVCAHATTEQRKTLARRRGARRRRSTANRTKDSQGQGRDVLLCDLVSGVRQSSLCLRVRAQHTSRMPCDLQRLNRVLNDEPSKSLHDVCRGFGDASTRLLNASRARTGRHRQQRRARDPTTHQRRDEEARTTGLAAAFFSVGSSVLTVESTTTGEGGVEQYDATRGA